MSMLCKILCKVPCQRAVSSARVSAAFKRHLSDVASQPSEIKVEFSNGRSMTLSTGKYARFADGCCVAQMGATSVMVTVVAKTKPTPGGFAPLVVDYRQKSAAAGRIPTNLLRRELGPTEGEILTSRLIDRSLRPLFATGFNLETQVVCNQLAVDGANDPAVAAVNAASCALALSDIPWGGPVGAVRLGLLDGELVVNPTRRELQASALDLVVSAAQSNLVVMLEAGAQNVLLPDLQKAIRAGAREAALVAEAIERLRKARGRAKRSLQALSLSLEAEQAVRALSETRLKEIFRERSHDKLSRDRAVAEVRQSVLEELQKAFPDMSDGLAAEAFGGFVRKVFRGEVLASERRCDGRSAAQLRPISCEVDLHPPLHGSALFQRGQTQVLATVSLDSPDSALRLDPAWGSSKAFFVHYDFPPYATGEMGRVGGVGRRETGHGALAERGLRPVLPAQYPFTVRLTAEVLESNGSSSMASVCAGSLALMDAGVPVSAPVAGVAIGLVADCEDGDPKKMRDYCLLTDILGIEDYMGDMDMKVAGTRKGVTALQADIKLAGLPLKVLMEALQCATDAKGRILDVMRDCIAEPRSGRKDCWPVSEQLQVETHKRPRLLGPGGIHLKRLFLDTGVQVTQVDDHLFSIFAPNQQAMAEAKELIDAYLVEDAPEQNLEFGGIYTAKVVEMRDAGVMVTLYEGMPPALLHISQLDQRKVAHPSVLGFQVGAELQVKYFGRDPVSGLMRLSRKVLQASAPQ